MRPLKTVRHGLEYAAVRTGLAIIHATPHRLAVAIVSALAELGYLTMRTRRRIALDNIRRAGVAESPADVSRIARASFRHFAVLAVESLKAETMLTDANWRDHVEIHASDETLAAIRAPGQGLILTTAHLGNWEVAAQIMADFKPVVAVARRMNNRLTDDLVQKRKLGHRFTLLPKHEATGAALLRVIRDGNILAMLIDQHARKHALRLMFMGRPASTYLSPALLHLRSGAPVGFAYCVRVGPMRFRLHLAPLIRRQRSRDRQADIRAIMESITRAVEDAVRRHPEQYLWAHRRWREES